MRLIRRALRRKVWAFKCRRWFWQLKYGTVTRNPFYPNRWPLLPRRRTKPFANSWYGREFKRCVRFAKWYKTASRILKANNTEENHETPKRN